MAELMTIARPYAEASFGLAREEGAAGLKSWSEGLARLAAVVASPEAHRLMGDPAVKPSQAAALLAEVAGGLSESQKKLLLVLAENGRLPVLPELAEQFEALRNEQEQVLAAEVTSAHPLSESQLTQIVATLSEKYGRPVKASVRVDADLIGGVSIAIGDEVIDASVSGKLSKMATALMN